jgi:hypothetical protein
MWNTILNFLIYNRSPAEQVAYEAQVETLRQGYRYYSGRLVSLEAEIPGYSAEKEMLRRKLDLILELGKLPPSAHDWPDINWKSGGWMSLVDQVPGHGKMKQG